MPTAHQATPTAPQATPTVPQAMPTVPQATPTVVPQATPTPAPRLNLGAVAIYSLTPSHPHSLTPSHQARIPVGVSAQHSLAIQRAAHGLPEGWQAGVTPDGRMYYMNHLDRTTTWEKPRLHERPAARAAASRPSPLSPVEQVRPVCVCVCVCECKSGVMHISRTQTVYYKKT